MPNLPYQILSFVIAVFIAFGLGWKVKGWKDDSEYKAVYFDTVQQINQAQAANLALSKQYAAEVKGYQQQSEEVKKHVKVEIEKSPVYRDCILPDSGVQLINAAVAEANQVKPTD